MADLPMTATAPAPAAAPGAPKPVLILVVLDKSGSMGIKRADVIGGFNVFLGEQKAQPGECRMSLVAFNTEKTVLFTALPLADVQPLTEKTYVPGGGTALLDAVAEAVNIADKDKRPEERVLCLIITDGEENSSRETTKAQLLAIIKEREARGDWTFTYLGPDPAKFHEQGYVSARMNAAGYKAADPQASFREVSHSTSHLRASASVRTDAFYQDKTGDQPKP